MAQGPFPERGKRNRTRQALTSDTRNSLHALGLLVSVALSWSASSERPAQGPALCHSGTCIACTQLRCVRGWVRWGRWHNPTLEFKYDGSSHRFERLQSMVQLLRSHLVKHWKR